MNTCLSAKLAALLLPLGMNAMLLVTVAYLYDGRSGRVLASSCAATEFAVAASANA